MFLYQIYFFFGSCPNFFIIWVNESDCPFTHINYCVLLLFILIFFNSNRKVYIVVIQDICITRSTIVLQKKM